MPVIELNDRTARNAAPATAGRYYELWHSERDGQAPGLMRKVTNNNCKSWFVTYTVRGTGRRRVVRLGGFPAMRFSEALKYARETRNKAGLGIEPVPERKREFTFTQAINIYWEQRLCRNKSAEKSWRWLLMAEKAFGSEPIDHITRSEIADLVYKHPAPASANAILRELRTLFNWLVDTGKLDRSSCERMKLPHKEKHRSRVLSDSELQAVWNACERIGYPFGPLVQLLILTGQRRGELASLRWTKDPAGKHGHIEGDWLKFPDTKNGKPHEVPLSPLALQIIKSVPRRGDYLFNRRKLFISFTDHKHKLDKASGVSSWVLHDLRRTVRTELARLRVPMEVAERILNHSPAFASGLLGTYDCHDYREEMREALTRWSEAFGQKKRRACQVSLKRAQSVIVK